MRTDGVAPWGDEPGHDGGGDGRLRSSRIPNWTTGGQNPARLARDLPDLALPALALPAFALPPPLCRMVIYPSPGLLPPGLTDFEWPVGDLPLLGLAECDLSAVGLPRRDLPT